jgi:DNA-directed RNA polymerase specialized sigma subunit
LSGKPLGKSPDREMTMEDNSKEYSQYEATHEEIAKEMGKSRAYVSLIEKEALEKLRKKLLWKHNVASVDDLL